MNKLLFLISLLILSCQSDNRSEISSSDEVNKVYDIFKEAYRTYNPQLIASIYEDSAIYLNPGDAIKFGHGAFLPGFTTMFANAEKDSAKLDINFKIIDREITNDRCVDIGYYRLIRKRPSQDDHTSVGKFITVLRRQKDGSWKFIVDGYSVAPLEAY